VFDRLVRLFKRDKRKEFKPHEQDSWGRTEVESGDMTSYRVSWNAEFERQVIKELVEEPRRLKELREEQARESTARFRAFLERERKKKEEESQRTSGT